MDPGREVCPDSVTSVPKSYDWMRGTQILQKDPWPLALARAGAAWGPQVEPGASTAWAEGLLLLATRGHQSSMDEVETGLGSPAWTTGQFEVTSQRACWRVAGSVRPRW